MTGSSLLSHPIRSSRSGTLRFIRIFTSRMSLAVRVAVLTILAVGATLTLVGTAVYVVVESEFESSLDESMISRAQAGVDANLGSLFAAGAEPDALALTDIKVNVLRAGEPIRLLTGEPNSSTFPPQFIGIDEREVSLGLASRSLRTAATDDGRPYRIVAVQSGPGEALVMAQSMESIEAALDRLRLILLFTGALGVAIAGLSGWAVASNGLRPVRRLTAATERVARTNDLQPIAVTGSDELARLTLSFNQMLSTLAESQRQQRQLVADAGHELRTPLTSLRTNIELMGQTASPSGRTLSDDERSEIMSDVRAQLEELTTLVGDLVELARDEPVARAPEPLDLAEVVEAALDRVRLRAGDTEFDVRLAPWMVVGEAQQLERAVTNLLDNAVKWGPDGSTVTVRLAAGVLSIADQGPGISADDLPHVFERFYRATESRTMPGSGLGLSIVRRAAERHGGTAEVTSIPGHGATFILRLPGADS